MICALLKYRGCIKYQQGVAPCLLNISDFYAEKYGLGIVLAGGNAGIGRYTMA